MSEAPESSPVGLLLVDKPIGPTSMDVCRRVRRALVRAGAPKRIRVGHGGTLDPLASGLLVVLVGRPATRLSDLIMAGEKEYTATVDFAHRSATDDREGPVTPVDVATPPSGAEVREACARFVGEIMQAPPAHSAVKIGGRRAYAEARAGRDPKPEPRPVMIHAIELEAYEFPRGVLHVRCGKGAYIRSLARDLGAALGTGGMLSDLRRTRIARFHVDDASKLDDLPEHMTSDDLLPIPE